jgi:hypothetical protein
VLATLGLKKPEPPRGQTLAEVLAEAASRRDEEADAEGGEPIGAEPEGTEP